MEEDEQCAAENGMMSDEFKEWKTPSLRREIVTGKYIIYFSESISPLSFLL